MAAEFSRENADDGSFTECECGCQCWTQGMGEQFVIVPCSLTCENYLYAVRQTQKAGNPIRFKEI